MNFVKKHVDTVIVIGGIVTSILWMNHKFSDVSNRFAAIEKDLAVVKAVLMAQGHLPKELAKIQTTEEKTQNG
jgi:hypothetical protein